MKTHWKKLSNTKYMGSWDFEPDEEKILTIADVHQEEVTAPDGTSEMKRVITFEETGEKPFIVNNTNAATIEDVLNTPYMEDWAGKGIILVVQKIQAFGKLTDGIRVRPVKPYECEECRKIIKGDSERTPLEIKQQTKKKFGKVLCAECEALLKGKKAGE
jgi:hypothetical protein